MIIGVILAGGASRRMGEDKAFVTVGSRPMWQWVATALEPLVTRTVMVGRNESPSPEIGALPDAVAGPTGPLAGIAAGMRASLQTHGPHAAVVCVAVDHPYVRTETLQRLIHEFEGVAVVPVQDDVRQVTCAVYPAAWQAAARREVNEGGSVQSLLDRMPHRPVLPEEWAAWGEDGRSWFSVDDPAALTVGRQRYGSGIE